MSYADEVGLLVTGIIGMLFVIFIGSFWYYSDSDVKEEQKTVEEIPNYEPKVLARIGTFTKVEIEGHWYLVDYHTSKSTIHMASCPCYNKDK